MEKLKENRNTIIESICICLWILIVVPLFLSVKDPKSIKYSEKLLKPKYLKALMSNEDTFELDPYNQEVNQSIENYFKNRDNVLFINPIDALCDGEDCVEKSNNEIYYSDNDHLSIDGTMKVLKHYEDAIIDFIDN